MKIHTLFRNKLLRSRLSCFAAALLLFAVPGPVVASFAQSAPSSGAEIEELLEQLVQKNWEVREKLIKEIKVLPREGLYKYLKPVITGTEMDRKHRLAAMAVAAARNLAEAEDDFLLLARDPEEEMRQMAVLCLGWLKNPGLLPELERIVKEDASTDIRVAAIESMDRIGAAGAIDTLHDLLGPGERNVRISALYVLGELAVPASLERIRTLFDDPDAQVRRYAMSVLRKFDTGQVMSLLRESWPGLSARARLDVVRTVGQLKDESAATLLREFGKDAPADLKIQIAGAVGQVGGPEAVSMLREMYEGSSGKLQVQVIRSLGSLKDSGSVALLLDTLNGGDPGIRGVVIEALVQIGDTGALPDLIELLTAEDSEPELRAALIGALGRFGDASVNPYLLEMLANQTDDQTKINLLLSLGNLPQPGLWKKLAPYLEDKNPQVANGAIYAISLLEDPEALDALYPLLESDDMNLQISVLTLLAEMRAPGASSRVLALLDSDNTAVKSTAIQVLGVLEDRSVLGRVRRELQESTDPNVRVASVMTLGELKDTASADLLAELLENGELDMKMASMEALGKIDGPVARKALRKQMDEGEFWIAYAAKISLARLGDRQVLDGILEGLKNSNPDERAETARMLGEVGGQPVIKPLLELLDDRAGIGVPSILVRDFMVGSTFYSGSGDRTQGVRDAAVEALKMATGMSFDWKVFGSEEEKTSAAGRWRSWWAEEGDTFELPKEPQYPQQ
jgi:HEAT repeat protein